jgi:hypothetical protein
MQPYLTAFCNYKRDNWVELLPLTEFAHNNSIPHSIQMTPFWANNNYHSKMQFKHPKDLSMCSQVQAASLMAGMDETDQILQRYIIEAHK